MVESKILVGVMFWGEKPVVGDVADPTSLKKALRGVRAVICPTKVNPLPYNAYIISVLVVSSCTHCCDLLMLVACMCSLQCLLVVMDLLYINV